MADSPEFDEAEVTKALMQEYISARQEVLLHAQLWKTQQKHGAILIPLMGLLIPLLIGQSISIPGTGITLPSTRWTDLVILFAISTVAFFIFYSALAIQFVLHVLAERCALLEGEINNRLGGPYLVWERLLTPLIWSGKSVIAHKNPDGVALLLAYLLIFIFAIELPLIVLTQILCGKPDWPLTFAVGAYTAYLFTALPFLIHINTYLINDAREDCRQIFQHATKGDGSPPARSGTRIIPIIVVAAFAAALVFVTIIRYTTVCTL